jgi:(1->4)-alpha-D-glucan 1-alpha-D-glucosylmutase
MKARKGSSHGYDVVDHTRINPELGGDAGFERLSEALRHHDLGLILDFVPNHVGVHFADNPWWLDVLEWGEASPHAVSFDIDWDCCRIAPAAACCCRSSARPTDEALEKGEIELRYDAGEGSFSAWYFEHRLPIAPERYGEILRMRSSRKPARRTARRANTFSSSRRATRGCVIPIARKRLPSRQELKGIAGAPKSSRAGSPPIGPAGARRQTLALHHLLERQHYRLGHWRLASSDINYRRFFDVNTLAGLRVEDAGTFNAIHRLVKRLISEGRLQGLRLDHIDGLRDPAQYFQRLRRLIRDAQGKATKAFYVVVEKILGEHEDLHRFAGVHGTTGYEWLNAITRC